jgi:hypothetical protein
VKPGRKPGFKGQARSLPNEKAGDGFKGVGLDGKAATKDKPRQGASGERPCPGPGGSAAGRHRHRAARPGRSPVGRGSASGSRPGPPEP